MCQVCEKVFLRKDKANYHIYTDHHEEFVRHGKGIPKILQQSDLSMSPSSASTSPTKQAKVSNPEVVQNNLRLEEDVSNAEVLVSSRYRKTNRKIKRLLDVVDKLVAARGELRAKGLRRLSEFKKARKIMKVYKKNRRPKSKLSFESEILASGIKLKMKKIIPRVDLDPMRPGKIKICLTNKSKDVTSTLTQVENFNQSVSTGSNSSQQTKTAPRCRVSRSKSSESSRPSTAEPVQIENEKLDGDGNGIVLKLTQNVSDEILAVDEDSLETITPSHPKQDILKVVEKDKDEAPPVEKLETAKIIKGRGRKRTPSDFSSSLTAQARSTKSESAPIKKRGRNSKAQEPSCDTGMKLRTPSPKSEEIDGNPEVANESTNKEDKLLSSKKARGRPKKSALSPENIADKFAERNNEDEKQERTVRKRRLISDSGLNPEMSKQLKTENKTEAVEEHPKPSVSKTEENLDSSLRKESLKIIIGCDKKAGKEKAFILKPPTSPQSETDKESNDPKYTVQSSGENPLKLKLKSGKSDPFKEEPKERLKLKLSFKTLGGKPVADVVDEKSDSKKKDKLKHPTSDDGTEKLRLFNVKIKNVQTLDSNSTTEESSKPPIKTKISLGKSTAFNQELSVHLRAIGNLPEANRERNLSESKLAPVTFSPEKKLFSADSKDDDDEEDIGLSKGAFNDLVSFHNCSLTVYQDIKC